MKPPIRETPKDSGQLQHRKKTSPLRLLSITGFIAIITVTPLISLQVLFAPSENADKAAPEPWSSVELAMLVLIMVNLALLGLHMLQRNKRAERGNEKTRGEI